MANIKITDLTAYTDPESTDVLPIVDITNDATKKVSIADLMENAGAGAEATPGIAFDGDPDTGIYRPAANQLAFSTGGTQRILIDDSGVVTVAGDLTVNGTTTTVNSTTVTVDDKNIELGSVGTPTDTTADGGGITLKGATDKTLNWVNSTDSWTSSENVDLASGKTYKIAGTDVLSATALGSAVQISSDNIPSGTIVNDDVNASAAIAGTKIDPDFGSQTVETTGVFSAAGGAQGTPSITFTGDLNTGIYSPGADQVAISTGGTGRLFVDAGGAVSIGDTWANNSNPVVYITKNNDVGNIVLKGNGGTSNALAVYSGGWSGSNQVFGVRGDGSLWGYSDLRLGTGSTYAEHLRIDSSGRVGVGTSSPDAPLHVKSSGTSSTIFRCNASDDVNLLQVYENSGGGAEVYVKDTSGAPKVGLHTSGASYFTGGNVGVGTTSPGRLMELSGDRTAILRFTNTRTTESSGQNIGAIEFYGNDTSGPGAGVRSSISVRTAAADGSGSTMRFSTADATTNNQERMRIDQNGRVGIGTGTPGAKLDIASLGGSSSTPAAIFRGDSGTGNSGGLALYNSSTDANERNWYLVSNSVSYGDFLIRQSSAQGTNPANTGNVRFYISRDGNVGIGTTNPQHALVVGSGTDDTFNVDTLSAGSGVTLRVFDDGNTDYEPLGMAAEYINFYIRTGVNSSAERMRLDSSGRLLVGTSSTSNTCTAVFTGRNDSSTANPVIRLQPATTAPASGNALGNISFSSNGTSAFEAAAWITANRDGGTWTAGSSHPGRLVFSTTADGASSPTERMRITNSGQCRMGNYVGNGSGTGWAFETQNSASAHETPTTTSFVHIYWINGNGVVGSISTNGSATAFNTSSDYRLKENVTAVTDGIARLQQLKPSRFNFIADPDKTVDGFLAHEAAAVVPEAVTGEKDAVDADGNPQYQGIDQSKLVPLLTAALQEAIAKIETLEAKVAALEAN